LPNKGTLLEFNKEWLWNPDEMMLARKREVLRSPSATLFIINRAWNGLDL
jgi:hypothetical protein